MRIFASDMVKKMMGRFGIPEDEPIQNRLVSRSIEAAQTKIEGLILMLENTCLITMT